MGMTEGHGIDWLFDGRGDRIEVADEVLFPQVNPARLVVGTVHVIHANGSVEIRHAYGQTKRWARDVVLSIAHA